MQTRRQFIKRAALGGAGLVVGGTLLNGRAQAASAARAASVAGGLTPYLDPMPILADNAINATGEGAAFNLSTALITSKLHSQLPETTLFGYLGGPHDGTSYLGPVIVAKSGTQVTASYTNDLEPDDYKKVFTNPLGSSYEQFLRFTPPAVRILTHLHGGLLTGDSDGNPYDNPGAFANKQTQTATYPNAGVSDGTPYPHPASLLWYHDHLLGDTRMNVVAGLAGAYLLRDSFDTGTNPLLPGPVGVYELPLVVQDRQFNSDGSLLYPVAPASTNGPWIGEYFGDAMLVNGKIWPTLAVEPAVYRFHVLNGCNARILSLRFVQSNDQAVPTYIIGAEGGLLPAGSPVATSRLAMGPAERFDVICDFRGLAGKTLYIRNNKPPKPVSTPAPALANVMRITVKPTASPGAPMSVPGAGWLQYEPLRTEVENLTKLGPPLLSGGTVTPRVITLNEVGAETPAWELNLNARPYGDPDDPSPMIEKLTWNKVEDWYFVNTTGDTHPMHTHLFTFTVVGRYNLDLNGLVAAYGTANGVPQLDAATQLKPFLTSKLMAPPPEETGLKDTVKTNPGQVTVVRAKFIPPTTAFDSSGSLMTQKYVHHCHIVEHEDNDMMERVLVQP